MTFAELRRSQPVSFQQPSDLGLMRSDRGFWAVTRHADIQVVSRSPERFCSGQGVGLGDVPMEFLELNASFLVMDAPSHTELRRVVSGAFTPRRIALLQDDITAEANRVVDELVEAGGGDLVQDLAMKLPLWTISNMMGVPPSMRDELYRAAEQQISSQDPDFRSEKPGASSPAVDAAMTLHRIAGELIADRRARESDDILSTLVHSEFRGEPLTDPLLRGIFVLFATAGNDTTSNSTSHGVNLFAENPEQWALLGSNPNLIPGAVEEIVRFATPVIHFRRTATVDTELGGVTVAKDDPVVMFYESANRDEAIFDTPERFDIQRNPNPHFGFGGGGPHFCLGAPLARTQLRALFKRLAERVATIEVGEPEYVVSNFVHGIKRAPVVLSRR